MWGIYEVEHTVIVKSQTKRKQDFTRILIYVKKERRWLLSSMCVEFTWKQLKIVYVHRGIRFAESSIVYNDVGSFKGIQGRVVKNKGDGFPSQG